MCFAMSNSAFQAATRTVHALQTFAARMYPVNDSVVGHSQSFADQPSSTSTYDTKAKNLGGLKLGKNFELLFQMSQFNLVK